MENALKRKVAGGAAGLALLAGAAGAAFADSSGGSAGSSAGARGYEREAFIDGVAKRVGVSPEKLKDAIRAEAKEHGGFPLLGPGGPPPFRGGPPPPGAPPPFPGPPPGRPPHAPPPVAAGLDAAAKYLGLTGPQFRKQLEAG